MDDDIEQRLVEAQAALKAIDETRALRQADRQHAVRDAREAGWSKYRIGQVLDVRGPTVDAIIASVEKAAEQ